MVGHRHTWFCSRTLLRTLCLVLMLNTWNEALAERGERNRRSVLQLADMIECTTGLKWVADVAADYIGYGCYCGPGGEGVPVDESDECCRIHDLCYIYLEGNKTCLSVETYFSSYGYELLNCQSEDVSITCQAASDYSRMSRFLGFADCGAALCQCDKAVALCLGKHRDTFNHDYEEWDRRNC
ncbi:neutral phospholipase A2 3-like [Ptychodera flava]|uniref:neutral phospholipase A2 3-like n=1 Tax=Ptychodera flava TaxID=63121 RepID=UPI00396A18F7